MGLFGKVKRWLDIATASAGTFFAWLFSRFDRLTRSWLTLRKRLLNMMSMPGHRKRSILLTSAIACLLSLIALFVWEDSLLLKPARTLRIEHIDLRAAQKGSRNSPAFPKAMTIIYSKPSTYTSG